MTTFEKRHQDAIIHVAHCRWNATMYVANHPLQFADDGLSDARHPALIDFHCVRQTRFKLSLSSRFSLYCSECSIRLRRRRRHAAGQSQPETATTPESGRCVNNCHDTFRCVCARVLWLLKGICCAQSSAECVYYMSWVTAPASSTRAVNSIRLLRCRDDVALGRITDAQRLINAHYTTGTRDGDESFFGWATGVTV